ncbi:MAG: DegT/DnrJ/EryC1/StrS aminotransferase family protein [Oscillospiraceae bacterium]|nr:DegT/DnrJ/EryC1/StrS aminotransferase family protein [Oscillospiraceae bacterium]
MNKENKTKNIAFSPPEIGVDEINAVSEVLKSGWITTGSKTKLFEKKIADYCGTRESVCMNSATSCLELALRLLGIGKGDEVITSAYTYSSSCSVICHVGAKPVLVDTQNDSFEMDYEMAESRINKNTKAIIPVDLGGVLCDYSRIFLAVNSKKHLFNAKNKLQEKLGRAAVIADSAHSFGAKKAFKNRSENFSDKFMENSDIYLKKSGSIADFTAFSFHAVKNLTTGEGGALTWTIEDKDIYENLSVLSLHGQSKDAFAKLSPGCWEYDILVPGYKCNMTDISAAIGLVQFDKFESFLKKRGEIIEIYNRTLDREKVEIFQNSERAKYSSKHLYMLRLIGKKEEFRNRLIEKLAENEIAANVHYKPLPMFTAYKNLGFNIERFPNAFRMYENEITLPLHTKMSVDDVFYISKIFNNF